MDKFKFELKAPLGELLEKYNIPKDHAIDGFGVPPCKVLQKFVESSCIHLAEEATYALVCNSDKYLLEKAPGFTIKDGMVFLDSFLSMYNKEGGILEQCGYFPYLNDDNLTYEEDRNKCLEIFLGFEEAFKWLRKECIKYQNGLSK